MFFLLYNLFREVGVPILVKSGECSGAHGLVIIAAVQKHFLDCKQAQ